jgi:uncharacterized protein
MVRLTKWQWIVLVLPFVGVVSFLLVAASLEINRWGINWIWGVVLLIFVGWRWLLVKWTRPSVMEQVEAVVAELAAESAAEIANTVPPEKATSAQKAELALQGVLQAAQADPPPWEDWLKFWGRCRALIEAVAHIYNPQVKYPLLNIYVPQAYTLLRGTVDDLDQWMQKLAPALNQMTIGQVYQAYEVYQKLEPSARRVWQAWNWAQWVLNPVTALARTASQGHSNRANRELLLNLGQIMREAALRNLARQAISLYSGMATTTDRPLPIATQPKLQTQTLREILAQAETPETLEQKPVNILLVGRTGAGKSSLINTLFVENKAAVDLLPSTDRIQDYHWQATSGETLTLWDSPGYEQMGRSDLREEVLAEARRADLLLLVTPALDPALEADLEFLKSVKAAATDLPTIAIVTQVDRLRPVREWQPPYDWQTGDRPKEKAIREATAYRAELLGTYCHTVLPLVTGDLNTGRIAWGTEALSIVLLEAISPAKQFRLARFLQNLEARVVAAFNIIDRYAFQMTTTQGLAALLKSPVLNFISTLATGSPNLALLLTEKIPVEQLPIVLGKLQMAYELYSLLVTDMPDPKPFDLLSLWSLLVDCSTAPDRNAWAFGHALTEYWTQQLTQEQLKARFNDYLNSYNNVK